MDPVIAQQFQLMQDALNASAQQNHQLNQQMQAIVAAQAAAAVVPPRPFVPVVKIAHPPTYDGAPALFDDWISSLDQHISYYQLGTEAEHIALAAAHLKGPARDWFAHLGGAAPTTWVQFVAALRARFQPVTTEEIARAQLHELVQGRSSINDYVASFRRLIIAIPSMDAATQMFQFLHGLKPSLQTIHRQVQPASLDAAIALAVRMGYTGSSWSSASSSSSSSSGTSAMDLSAIERVQALQAKLAEAVREVESTSASSSSAAGSVSRAEIVEIVLAAMDQHGRNNGSGSSGRGAQGAGGGYHGARGLPRIKGFSEERVKAYMAADKCFGCDAIGHGSRTCPKRKVDKDGKVSWGK